MASYTAPPIPKNFEQLTERLREVYHLARIATLLGWDELCMMPKGGAATRADHKATLEHLVHAGMTSDEVGSLIEDLVPWAETLAYDSFEACYVRVARRNYYRYKKIPPSLVVAMSKAASKSYHAWLEAKAANDFSIWCEPQTEVVRLLIELAEALGYPESRYDALLDRREPGIRASQVARLFDRVRAELTPFARAVGEKSDAVDDRVLHQPFDVAKQWDLGVEFVKAIGFDFTRGRIDQAPHPISYSISPGDVRIAPRANPNFIGAWLFSCLHEAGHGIYFQGVPDQFRASPLDGTTAQGANLSPVFGGISTGLHEGQSRLWENVLGRSREFWRWAFPKVRAAFPAQTDGTDAEHWYRAVNRSKPSFIRVDADELTYDLHIMLRFDLEKALLDETLKVADLPEAWNERSRVYFGVEPPDDARGVLQDLQWSRGGHTGFPSYTLGNIVSMQLWQKMESEVGPLGEDFAKGSFLGLRDWMRDKLHRHGSSYEPAEVLQRVVGTSELDPAPYLAYLKRKFGEIYKV